MIMFNIAAKKRREFQDQFDSSVFRLPFGVSVFDEGTLHIMSRHNHPTDIKGIFVPLAHSVWVAIIFSALMCLLLSRTIKQKGILVNGNAIVKLIMMLFNMAIVIFYNLDLRANIIEPNYEKLSRSLSEIDFGSDYVTAIPPAYVPILAFSYLQLIKGQQVIKDKVARKHYGSVSARYPLLDLVASINKTYFLKNNAM